jgi:O-antigen/teichoic acid export membrane protein
MPQSGALTVTKNTVALSVARVSSPLFSFLLVIYAARSLGATDFGRYVLVRTYFDLFLGLCATGLSIVVTREIAKRPSSTNQYLNASVVLVLLLTLASNAILVILAHALDYAPEMLSAVYLAALALLPSTVGVLSEAVFVAFQKAEYVTLGTVIENTVRVGVSILALHKGYGLIALFTILLVTSTLKLWFYLTLVKRHVSTLSWHFDWGFLKQLIRDWTIFAAESWLSNLFSRLDILLLSFFHGELAAGLYGAAGKVLNPFSVLAYSFTSAMFPYMSRLFVKSKSAFQEISHDVLTSILALALFGAVLGAIMADRLILLIYTAAYSDSIPLLQVLVWAIIPLSLNPFLSHILFARQEQGRSLRVMAISLAFYVAVALWLIPRWGGLGTAWAYLLAISAACCLYLAFALSGHGAMRTLSVFGRTILAAACVGILLLIFRQTQLIILLVSALVLYVLLLLVFRVPSPGSVELLRGAWRAALRWLDTIGPVFRLRRRS